MYFLASLSGGEKIALCGVIIAAVWITVQAILHLLQKSMSYHYGNLGVTYQKRGQLDKAEEMYEKVLKIDEKLGRSESMANTYSGLGLVYMDKGELDKAKEMHIKSLEIGERIGLQEVIARQYDNLGALYHKGGDKKKAIEYWEEALSIFKKIGMQPEVEKTQWLIDGLEEK